MIKDIQLALLKKLPGSEAQFNMAPPARLSKPSIPSNARQSAVCILLFEKAKEVHTLLMKRSDDGGTHSGQISFPGGRFDTTDLNLTYTALRECEEEIGIGVEQIEVLGNLTPLYIPPSNFVVTPIICTIQKLPTLLLSPREVAAVYPISLRELFAPETKSKHRVKLRNSEDEEMITPIYLCREKIIWGATAMMLAELEEIYLQVK